MIEYITDVLFDKKGLFLVLTGIAATAVSFIYPYISVSPVNAIIYALMLADAALLFSDARFLSSLFTSEKENKEKLDIINAVFIMLMYFSLFIIIAGFLFDTLTLEIVKGALGLALLLGPCILLVLPVLWLILTIFG
ncbi:MAG: hypothetical protein IJX27_03100 [Clostridia bacterium]|nr:hypothetical protein [Clostridia bacterium]